MKVKLINNRTGRSNIFTSIKSVKDFCYDNRTQEYTIVIYGTYMAGSDPKKQAEIDRIRTTLLFYSDIHNITNEDYNDFKH